MPEACSQATYYFEHFRELQLTLFEIVENSFHLNVLWNRNFLNAHSRESSVIPRPRRFPRARISIFIVHNFLWDNRANFLPGGEKME